MFPLTGSLSLAAAGAILALTAASIPARADELAQNLGPVGPREPILTWVGSKRCHSVLSARQWQLRCPRGGVGPHRRQR